MKKLFSVLLVLLSIPVFSQEFLNISQQFTNCTPGSINQVAIRFRFYSTALTQPHVEQFVMNTNGTTNTSDLLNAKLYFTGSSPVLFNPVQFGNTVANPNGVFSFSSDIAVLYGDSYFWLVFDISPSAQIGNIIDAECTMIKFFNWMPAIVPSPSAIPGYMTVAAGGTGIYTIGNGGNFPNLTLALSVVYPQLGTNDITLELLSSYSSSAENFPVNFPAPPEGVYHSLTIRPHSNVNDTIKIISSAPKTFSFNGGRYIIVDGRPGGTGESKKLKIINTSTNGHCIRFTDSAAYNIIRYSIIEGVNSSNGAVEFVAGSSGGSYYNTVSSCIIKNNTLEGLPWNSIYAKGSSSFKVKGTVIEKCDIRYFNRSGIYISADVQEILIDGCEIHQDTTGVLISGSNISGIIIDSSLQESAAGNFTISNNRIYNLFTNLLTWYEVRGIEIKNLSVPYTYLIYNNFISLGHYNYVEAHISGIDYASTCSNATVSIFHNNISIGGSIPFPFNTACVVKAGPAYQFNMANNILSNRRYNLGGSQYSVQMSSTAGISWFNYNDYYVNGPTAIIGKWGSTDILTLAQWKTVSGVDQNTVSKPVNFVSDNDLHISGASLGDLDLAGIKIIQIPYDIDDELRPNLPYMGADENLQYPLPVELISFNADVINSYVKLSWTTVSEKNNLGFEIERRPEFDLNWSKIGFVNGSGTASEPHEYEYKDRIIRTGRIFYRLKQIDYDGTSSYSGEIEVNTSVPMLFNLSQNYPNPFNPSTKIEFDIPQTDIVKLSVYNTTGEKVNELLNEIKEPGRYTINFDGSGLSSGIYFYELKTAAYRSVRKMLLLK